MDRTGCQLSRTEPSRTRTNGSVLRSSVRTAVLNRTAATLLALKTAYTTVTKAREDDLRPYL